MSKKSITKVSSSFISKIGPYWHIIASVVVVGIIGIWLAYVFRNQINPDGISYIQVARHWAHFDIKQAVNGYWAPLISWLLVPFLWLNIDPLFSFRVLNFTIALLPIVALLVIQKASNHGQRLVQFLYLSSFGILLQIWASSVITPDLLSGAVLFAVFIAIHLFLKNPRASKAILLGVLLSALYFSKSIGFYISLFIVGFLLVYALRYKEKHLIRPILLSTALFLAICLPWITAISLKYNKPTISTAGSYNFSLIGPERPPHPQTVPTYTPTHSSTAISAWDDPSYYKMPSWSIQKHATYYINYIAQNASRVLSYLFSLSPLIVVGLWALVSFSKSAQLSPLVKLFCGTTLLVCVAYSLILVEDRYLWFIAISIIALGSIYVSRQPKTHMVGAILFSTLLFIYSLLSFAQIYQARFPAEYSRNDQKLVSQQARKIIPSGSTIAGPGLPMYFCYFSNTRCVAGYNLPEDPQAQKLLISTMKKQGVQFYIEFSLPKEGAILRPTTILSSGEHHYYDYIHDRIRTDSGTTLAIYDLSLN